MQNRWFDLINKKLLVIGGTGALGKTLLKKYHKKCEIVVFSRDEHKHVALRNKYPKVKFRIGDVRNQKSILQAINEYKPDVVINAAALKHVPVCEDNVYESVQTNILGHQNLIEAVCTANHRIKSLVFISTDKACKPINVYGMCKAISEKLYTNFAERQHEIKVVLARYGNVLESTGSVIPFFKNLIEEGTDYLPITHKEMTRFLLTLDHAVDLIEWAYNHPDSHGSIVVPNIKALKVTDIASALCTHYNVNNVKLKIVGIRPGEKLHEEMVSLEESVRTKKYEGYFMITNEIHHNEPWSFSSRDSLIDKKGVVPYLLKNGVLS